MVEEKKEEDYVVKANKIEDFPCLGKTKLEQPIQKLDSQLVTTLVFSNIGRKKKVLKVMLTLCTNSRGFIIVNKGLEGQLIVTHDNSASWFDEFALSASFRIGAGCYSDKKESKALSKKL